MSYTRFYAYPRSNLLADNIRVIDGDTIECDIYFPDEKLVIREKLRLNRINAPEVTTFEGLEIKMWLCGFLDKKSITVDLSGKDKYGRLLANVYVDQIDLSSHLQEKFSSVKSYGR
jgi:endonuclease YncB( thermonuclease family)